MVDRDLSSELHNVRTDMGTNVSLTHKELIAPLGVY